MRALITGATGFIGRELVKRLDQPVVLTREPARAKELLGKVEAYAWDAMTAPPPAALERVEAVFHLAGDPVAEGRWTAKKKQRIRDSRVIGTRNLVAGLRQLGQPPAVLVSASAIDYYPDHGDEAIDESLPPGTSFLSEVCVAWERESHEARQLGIRVVNPRIGIVLGPGGGALSKMLLPFKLGVGGRLGHGRQWMSWIHISDVVGLLLHAASSASVTGAMNATAPNLVTNREFTAALARTLHRPAVLPAPAFGLKLALGEVTDVLLASHRVLPRVAEQTGYAFQYPQLDAALRAATASA
ncbi:MAG: TIGR01777 family protein [Planctomycetes bacterium]|nr:TIGR01777 family protein [Planctomycetota bacterium]